MRYTDLATCPYFRSSTAQSGKSITWTWTPVKDGLLVNEVITYDGNPVKRIVWTSGQQNIFIDFANYDGSVCFDKTREFKLQVSEVKYTPIHEVGPE